MGKHGIDYVVIERKNDKCVFIQSSRIDHLYISDIVTHYEAGIGYDFGSCTMKTNFLAMKISGDQINADEYLEMYNLFIGSDIDRIIVYYGGDRSEAFAVEYDNFLNDYNLWQTAIITTNNDLYLCICPYHDVTDVYSDALLEAKLIHSNGTEYDDDLDEYDDDEEYDEDEFDDDDEEEDYWEVVY